jgi:hypothetical protein
MNVQANSPGVLSAAVRANFIETYTPTLQASRDRLSSLVEFVPSDKIEERFAYFKSPAHMKRWKRGEAISMKGFADVTWTVVNRDWGIGVEWHENDEADDQTHSLVKQARGSGDSSALLDERVVFQIITAATDPDLLPAIPNAADGSALHAAGSSRFGRSGGNIVTGTGVATPSAIENDYFSALTAMMAFQDPEGQPLHDPSVFDGEFLIIAGSANLKVFQQAFKANVVPLASSTATSNAGVSNVIMAGAYKVRLWITPRITNNDWSVWALGAKTKPFVITDRQPLREAVADMSNSDRTRSSKLKSLQWDKRNGYGVATPYASVLIDN